MDRREGQGEVASGGCGGEHEGGPAMAGTPGASEERWRQRRGGAAIARPEGRISPFPLGRQQKRARTHD